MKKIVKISAISIIGLGIIITGVCFTVREILLNGYKNENTGLPEGFTITAHTGCMNTQENSLDSIKAGVENGASIVEFDLYLTDDKIPVLSHNEPTGMEITLEEAFAYLAKFDNIKANVDAKTYGELGQVYTLAAQYGVADRIFFTGIKAENAEKVKTDCPQIPYYINIDVDKRKNTDSEYISSLIETVKEAGGLGINFNCKSASKELVNAFHENGLKVSIWTVDDEYNMYKILSMGPDNITTRKPDELSRILAEKVN